MEDLRNVMSKILWSILSGFYFAAYIYVKIYTELTLNTYSFLHRQFYMVLFDFVVGLTPFHLWIYFFGLVITFILLEKCEFKITEY